MLHKAKSTKSGKSKHKGAFGAAVLAKERSQHIPAPNRSPRKKGGVTVAEKKSADEGGNGQHNVDQIRDLLFGGQMREYERRFQELSKRLEQESARLRGDMEKRLLELEKRVDEKLDRVAKQLRQEVGDRGKAVDELESRILQAASSARNEVNAAINALQESLDAAAERERKAFTEVTAHIESTASQADAAVVAARDQLRRDKVDREDLAAYMTELALRLRGEFELPTSK